MYDKINLWFAKDNDNKITTIDEVTKEVELSYTCPICGSEVVPKAIDSKKVSPHFAHIDKSKCNGETMIHFWVKNELIKVGDKFNIYTDKDMQYICKNIFIEKEYKTIFGIYKPDITIETECGQTVFIEVAHRNKKNTEDFIKMWNELGCVVGEVTTKDIINNYRETNNIKCLFASGKPYGVKRSSVANRIITECCNSEVDEISKEKAKELKWVWDEVLRYKLDLIDIDDVLTVVYNANEQEIISKIIKAECSGLINDIYNYNIKKVSDSLQSIKDETNNNCLLKVVDENRKIFDRLYGDISVRVNYENSSKYVSIDPRFNHSEIKSKIKKTLEDLEFEEYICESIGKIQQTAEKIVNTKNLISKKYSNIVENYPYLKVYKKKYDELRIYINFGYEYGKYLSINKKNFEKYLDYYYFYEEIDSFQKNNSFNCEDIGEVLKVCRQLKKKVSKHMLDIKIKNNPKSNAELLVINKNNVCCDKVIFKIPILPQYRENKNISKYIKKCLNKFLLKDKRIDDNLQKDIYRLFVGEFNECFGIKRVGERINKLTIESYFVNRFNKEEVCDRFEFKKDNIIINNSQIISYENYKSTIDGIIEESMKSKSIDIYLNCINDKLTDEIKMLSSKYRLHFGKMFSIYSPFKNTIEITFKDYIRSYRSCSDFTIKITNRDILFYDLKTNKDPIKIGEFENNLLDTMELIKITTERYLRNRKYGTV